MTNNNNSNEEIETFHSTFTMASIVNERIFHCESPSIFCLFICHTSFKLNTFVDSSKLFFCFLQANRFFNCLYSVSVEVNRPEKSDFIRINFIFPLFDTLHPFGTLDLSMKPKAKNRSGNAQLKKYNSKIAIFI